MKTKKLIPILLAAAALLLAGCGNKNTADIPGAAELLQAVPDLSNTDLSVNIDYSIQYPTGQETDDTNLSVSGNEGDPEDAPFQTSYGIYYNIQTNGDLTHATGTESYTYEADGIEPAADVVKTEIWTDKREDPALSYIFDGAGTWYKETNSDSSMEYRIADTLAYLKAGNFTETTVEETEDSSYMVTLQSTPEETPIIDLVTAGSIPAGSDDTVTISVFFDKETKTLQKALFHTEAVVNLGYEEEPLLSDFLCDVTIILNSTGNVTLKLPEGMAEDAIDLMSLYEDTDPSLIEQDPDSDAMLIEPEVSGNDISGNEEAES